MSQAEPTVFVVDDDEAMCESLQWLLESEGFSVATYDSAEAFLGDYQPSRPGCLLLDVRMHSMSGLELQAELARDELSIPVIIITGHGDIPMAVRAVKRGAVDFLEKPVNDQVLLERVRHALALDARTREQRERHSEAAARLQSLTPREREVMDLVVIGKPNKQIAARLGISEKTVEVHRKRVMDKMGATSAVELVRIVMAAKDRARPAP